MKKSYNFSQREKQFFRLLLKTVQTLQDPIWRKINITRIKIVGNFASCQIFYTLFDLSNSSPRELKLATKTLYLRKLLASKWRGYKVPQLFFLLDKDLLQAEEVSAILTKLKPDQ